jgi:hypothetical protein
MKRFRSHHRTLRGASVQHYASPVEEGTLPSRKLSNRYHFVHRLSTSRGVRGDVYEPVRVHIELMTNVTTSEPSETDTLAIATDNIINVLFPVVLDWFSKAVYVKRVQGNLTVGRECVRYDSATGECTEYDGATGVGGQESKCAHVTIPREHLSSQSLYDPNTQTVSVTN